MSLGKQSLRSFRLLASAFALVGLSLAAVPAEAAKGDRLAEQMAFGIEMAKRGLWSEAIFRFSRVLKERPGDVRVLNNMAVGYEAIGEFDLALEHYKRALEGDSSNRELRRNYAQFVEFYESLKPEEPEQAEPEEAAAEASETVAPESADDPSGEGAADADDTGL